MNLITESTQLAAFCRHIAGAPFITVDTEFMREKTFWPILCVLQVAGGNMDEDPNRRRPSMPGAGTRSLAVTRILKAPGVLRSFTPDVRT